MQTTTTEYRREYNKENYKRIQVYIEKNDYENILNQLKKENPKIKISGYIKSLIEKDLRERLGGGLRRMIDFLVNIATKATELIAWIIEKEGNIITWLVNLF